MVHTGRVTELKNDDVNKIFDFVETLPEFSCHLVEYSNNTYTIKFETFNQHNVVRLYRFLIEEGIKE